MHSRYLGAVQQFISLRIYSGGGASSVLVGVHFVHLLYLANQDHPKVSYDRFRANNAHDRTHETINRAASRFRRVSSEVEKSVN